jgi:hypothetical protein
MSKVERDESREHRIDMEIIVDAYNEEEQAMGWYYYLDNKLNFPFKAKWITSGRTSESEEVEVVNMSSEEDCQKEMFVEVLYKEGTVEDVFSVALSDIEPIESDDETQEAIADWHYWVHMGYEFSEE